MKKICKHCEREFENHASDYCSSDCMFSSFEEKMSAESTCKSLLRTKLSQTLFSKIMPKISIKGIFLSDLLSTTGFLKKYLYPNN